MPTNLREYGYPILATILIVGFAFYWFQVRPSIIRHSCSWVLHHTDAVPAKPAQGTPLTQDQTAANQKAISSCDAKYPDPTDQFLHCTVDTHPTALPAGEEWVNFQLPSALGVQQSTPLSIPYPDTYVPAVPAQPATNWWGQASDEQYQFCVQDKGL
jgi:hypothetical protein